MCWEQGLNDTDDVDILVIHWSSLFFSIVDKHAPIKSIRVSEKQYPWVNTNLNKLMQSRDEIRRWIRTCKSPLLMSSNSYY